MNPFLRPRTLLLGLACLLPLGVAGAAAPQDEGPSKEQAALIEEQELLARKLARLLASMEKLAERFEAEGRIHATKLLRDALEHARRRGEDGQTATLEELMSTAREELTAEQSMQSIETQTRVIADLERLLAILMDRPDIEELEGSLEELRRFQAKLSGLIDDEGRLQEQTEGLREQVATEAQRALEDRIEAALAKQRELLQRNETGARESGALDLEKLERDLAELVEDQHTDARVLESWDPAALPSLEALSPTLMGARRALAEAERLRRSAEALRGAAEAGASEKDPANIEDEIQGLEQLAENEARAARASGSEGARRSADRLEGAAKRLRDAGSDRAAREEAAREVGELAAELGRDAGEAAKRAVALGEEARRALRELGASSPAEKELTEALEQKLAAAEAKSEGADRALFAAARALEQAIEDQKFLGPALSASQRQNAERAERIREGLGRLAEPRAEKTAPAREKLEEASETMRAASERAAESDSPGARDAAAKAEEALREALASLSAAREAGAAESPGEPQLAAEQRELAEEVDAMQPLTEGASLDEPAREEVKDELRQASEAMREAAREMGRNRSGAAAKAQRSATEALQRAAQRAGEGVTPQTPEDRARAEELAREQERIEKELYDFRQRYEERKDSQPLPSLEGAQGSARAAKQALEEGDLGGAQEQEQEAKRQMEQALSELKDEEEQYQSLRDEELLFRIAQEVATLLGEHESAAEETLEVDAGREPGARASRGERLRLRKISRQEEALAERSAEIHEALALEESVVFAELLDRIEHDLRRVAELTGETGGYQSGDRVQALQADVTTSLKWLKEALEEEKKRREEQQSQPQQSPPPKNRLVPDVAELKLLARMERDVIDQIDELLILYPELKEEKEIDPLLLEEIGRLGHRHQRSSELFKTFRERLGYPDPGPAPVEELLPPGGEGTDESKGKKNETEKGG